MYIYRYIDTTCLHFKMQEDRFHGKGKTTLENGDQHLGAYRYLLGLGKKWG